MKYIISILSGASLVFSGCKDFDVKSIATPANTRIATAIVCSNTLNFAVNEKDRTEVANYIYSVAHGVRTLTAGRVPSPEELKATIELFTPDASRWVFLGTSISSVYGGIHSQIKGDPKLALEYLEAIASGCEDAAAAYRPPS